MRLVWDGGLKTGRAKKSGGGSRGATISAGAIVATNCRVATAEYSVRRC
jgi:hypothetical protein